jgi:AcrR family transcriptional regulator
MWKQMGTRETILAAAGELFYQNGIHRTSMDLVILSSGYSKPTVYKHFPTKTRLIDAVMDDWATARQTLLQEIMDDTSVSATKRVLGVFDFFEHWARTPGYRGCGLVIGSFEMTDSDATSRVTACRHKQWMTDQLKRLVTESGLRSPARLATSLTQLLEGATVLAHIHNDPAQFRIAKTTARELMQIHTRSSQ